MTSFKSENNLQLEVFTNSNVCSNALNATFASGLKTMKDNEKQN